jgi:hypothetical protein
MAKGNAGMQLGHGEEHEARVNLLGGKRVHEHCRPTLMESD